MQQKDGNASTTRLQEERRDLHPVETVETRGAPDHLVEERMRRSASSKQRHGAFSSNAMVLLFHVVSGCIM